MPRPAPATPPSCAAVPVIVCEPVPSATGATIPPVANTVYVSVVSVEDRTSPSLSTGVTLIVASSPGRYEVLSNSTLTSSRVVPPTRSETAGAVTPVVTAADELVVTVMFAVPAATAVTGMTNPPSVASYVSEVVDV